MNAFRTWMKIQLLKEMKIDVCKQTIDIIFADEVEGGESEREREMR